MELSKIDGLCRPIWQRQPVQVWSDNLKTICGNFNAIPEPDRSDVNGLVEHRHAGGVDFAHVAGLVAGIVLRLILRLLLPIQDAEHAAQIQC